ncbi:unnamed protein product, partial [Nesidiocoris tenuis]
MNTLQVMASADLFTPSKEMLRTKTLTWHKSRRTGCSGRIGLLWMLWVTRVFANAEGTNNVPLFRQGHQSSWALILKPTPRGRITRQTVLPILRTDLKVLSHYRIAGNNALNAHFSPKSFLNPQCCPSFIRGLRLADSFLNKTGYDPGKIHSRNSKGEAEGMKTIPEGPAHAPGLEQVRKTVPRL